MIKKDLLLTFDYELFLGEESGGVKGCLIEPTNQVCKIMEDGGVRGIFFVDTTYLWRLRKHKSTDKNLQDDFDLIQDQLRSMLAKGHVIYPHIHPHWISANYNSATRNWSLGDTSKYRFHNISTEERVTIWNESMSVLKEMLDLNSTEEIEGFRAGGWCIQPFEDFVPYFKEHGIRYEFSVLPGRASFSTAQYFDFSAAEELQPYSFGENILAKDISGAFVQYPISTVGYTRLDSILEKVWLKVQYKILRDFSFGQGKGQIPQAIEKLPQAPKNIKANHDRISIELMTPISLPKYKAFSVANNYIHFISHPKMLTRSSLYFLGEYLKWMNARFELNSDFKAIKLT